MSNFALMTDSELFGFFSDLYKDVNGVRPVSGWDRASVVAFCESWTSPEGVEQLTVQWAEEDECFKALEEKWNRDCEQDALLNDLRTPSRYEAMAERAGYCFS